MVIDPGTLRDLDVLTSPIGGGRSLLELVDRTRTRVGREHLRRRLRQPASSADRILTLQRAHRALASQSDAVRAIVDRTEADTLERYLNSNWQLPGPERGLGRLAAGCWQGGWRGQHLREVEAGQARVASLISAATSLRTVLAGSAAGPLQELGAVVDRLLGEPDVRTLAGLARRSGMARLRFDELARGTAKPILDGLLDGIGQVEAMWSLARATIEHGWSYPRPSGRLRASGLCHPLLWTDGVRNDVDLDESVRVCFLTGPNMAGKSTFLKAVALAFLLAQAGCGVAAASFEFPVVDALFSSIRVWDSMTDGESFYLAEVRRVRALAEALHEHGSAFAVLDEPLRGTNVHDAAEATLAVITRLANHPGALVFIASHIGDVAPAIARDPHVELLHFSADVSGDRPRFDYRLRDGLSAQRLGMALLRQEGVLEMLERPTRAARPGAAATGRPGDGVAGVNTGAAESVTS